MPAAQPTEPKIAPKTIMSITAPKDIMTVSAVTDVAPGTRAVAFAVSRGVARAIPRATAA